MSCRRSPSWVGGGAGEAGAEVFGAVVLSIRAPHSKQNFAVGPSSLPHRAQRTVTATPHSGQNFASAGISCPQDPQVMRGALAICAGAYHESWANGQRQPSTCQHPEAVVQCPAVQRSDCRLVQITHTWARSRTRVATRDENHDPKARLRSPARVSGLECHLAQLESEIVHFHGFDTAAFLRFPSKMRSLSFGFWLG